ncbi:MAG: hypothetical protein ACFFD5_01990 [Candidatus Thorarchaeota archaeon]
MSNIYVPIDSSDLSKSIPEGEDIIYSSLCKGEGTSVADNKKHFWNTHLLMTNKGLYFKIPLDARYSKKQIAKLDPKLEVFAPWYNISSIVSLKDLEDKGGKLAKMAIKLAIKEHKEVTIHIAGLETGSGIGFYCTLFLMRDPNFETEEKYNQRIYEIKELTDPIRKPIRLEIAKKLHQKFDENPKYNIKEFKNEYPDFDNIIFSVIKKDWKKGKAPGTSLV